MSTCLHGPRFFPPKSTVSRPKAGGGGTAGLSTCLGHGPRFFPPKSAVSRPKTGGGGTAGLSVGLGHGRRFSPPKSAVSRPKAGGGGTAQSDPPKNNRRQPRFFPPNPRFRARKPGPAVAAFWSPVFCWSDDGQRFLRQIGRASARFDRLGPWLIQVGQRYRFAVLGRPSLKTDCAFFPATKDTCAGEAAETATLGPGSGGPEGQFCGFGETNPTAGDAGTRTGDAKARAIIGPGALLAIIK